nr:MAG TPA: hypothetical protein [Caudoviricetes sp.]
MVLLLTLALLRSTIKTKRSIFLNVFLSCKHLTVCLLYDLVKLS